MVSASRKALGITTALNGSAEDKQILYNRKWNGRRDIR